MDIIKLYNKILREETIECLNHSIKYDLPSSYNHKYDAIGTTYYRILNESQNKDLIEYAEKEFLK